MTSDATPQDFFVGQSLRTLVPLLGLLDESINDSTIHRLNVTAPPGHHHRFTKQRIDIPVGTRFRVIGYRSLQNSLRRSQDCELVLEPAVKITDSFHEVHMRVSLARGTASVPAHGKAGAARMVD
ncbi:hypothetical protein [Variovorax sp.]|uniref:hypothetical protein n=1 Tax=Variovorax sp. TaxID=1871043 RepID=UPI0037DA469F